jgi:hypothetical protein
MINLLGSQACRIWNHEVSRNKKQHRRPHEHEPGARAEIPGVDVVHVRDGEEGHPGRERLADDADGDGFGAQAVGGELGCDGPAHPLDEGRLQTDVQVPTHCQLHQKEARNGRGDGTYITTAIAHNVPFALL